MNPKINKHFNQVKIQKLHRKTGKIPKIKIDTIKADKPRAQPHEIPEVGKTTKSGTILEIPSTHNYNAISRIKRVNHMNTFKNTPNFFPFETTEKIRLHIGSD